MGVFEFDKFAVGTEAIANTLAELTDRALPPSSAAVTLWQLWKKSAWLKK
jgi:hypothetical protein